MEVVCFGTYNIRNSRDGGLKSISRRMDQVNQITNGVYVWESACFCVVVSDTPSRHHGGVALFYKESPRFVVEAHKHHSPNVIRFHMVMGRRHWHMVGCYFAPRNNSTLESVVTAIVHRPRGVELLIFGDFNADL